MPIHPPTPSSPSNGEPYSCYLKVSLTLMKDSQKLLTSLHPQPQTLKPSLNPKLAYTGVRVQGLGVSSTTEVCGFRVFVLYRGLPFRLGRVSTRHPYVIPVAGLLAIEKCYTPNSNLKFCNTLNPTAFLTCWRDKDVKHSI